jgi:hypothetical protein
LSEPISKRSHIHESHGVTRWLFDS